MGKTSPKKPGQQDPPKPRVNNSEHARLNDHIQVLLEEDYRWDLDK